ncbi:hypothetical protein [Chiayiivirga flava]|uniref:Ribonucleoside-diphosphate reductase alpha chain n=1 Tax=Chiayiivirga flava TaxID=659595 RepID=A0A7W8D4H7_9GAMM|nr:hypothetical protein [Chiayiivirga flava]MBB5206537.1 ribonucleoside-diphosphate reductase alpha chain [Chiayiivirga flava]
MQGSTTFVSRAAVDVWDAQFRWREGRRIRDRVVDDTWRRVATAVAAAEGAAADVWATRFVAAFRAWRLLPDPAVLRFAGTHMHPAKQAVGTATVNVLAFVRRRPDGTRSFDAAGFRATASLALRLADDATLLWATRARPEPRVGLMGLGEALDALGLACAGDAAVGFCSDVAELLALGCLRSNLQLGMERGPAAIRNAQAALCRPAHARRGTLRHAIVTRLQPQPDLALLANGVALPCGAASGVACGADPGARVCGAMQPWIDDPIACDPTYRHPAPTETSPCRPSSDR